MTRDNQALRPPQESTDNCDIIAAKKELLDKVELLSENDCISILLILKIRGLL